MCFWNSSCIYQVQNWYELLNSYIKGLFFCAIYGFSLGKFLDVRKSAWVKDLINITSGSGMPVVWQKASQIKSTVAALKSKLFAIACKNRLNWESRKKIGKLHTPRKVGENCVWRGRRPPDVENSDNPRKSSPRTAKDSTSFPCRGLAPDGQGRENPNYK